MNKPQLKQKHHHMPFHQLSKQITTLIFLIGFCASASAQLTTTPSSDAFGLSDMIAGSGVQVTNATVNCGSDQSSGFFNGSNSNLGINSGIILATGDIQLAEGPNTSGTVTQDLGAAGDADLAAQAGIVTYDACALEFDVQSVSNTIKINYVFASEEYPERVCALTNDPFAIFVSGPGITGQQNIATIPGVGSDVSINHVNNGIVGTNGSVTNPDCELSNTTYFINNQFGTTIQYDGFTQRLTAEINVSPCSSYHFKIVVADAGNGLVDSGVFLEQGSLRSGADEVYLTTDNTPFEGCIDGDFIFNRPLADPAPLTISYSLSGTASFGVDYTVSPVGGSVTIPAGQTSTTLTVQALDDLVTEGNETIILQLMDGGCAGAIPNSSTIMEIRDDRPIVTLTKTDVECFGDATGEIEATATGANGAPYSFYLTGPNHTGTTFTTNITNLVSGNYMVTAQDADNCESYVENISIAEPPVLEIGPITLGDNSCFGDINGSIGIDITGGVSPYNVDWSGPSGYDNSFVSNDNADISNLAPGDYILNIADDHNCPLGPINVTLEQPPAANITSSQTNANCYNGTNGTIEIQVSEVTPQQFAWSSDNGYSSTSATTGNIANLEAGHYQLTLTDDNGCTYDYQLEITEPSNMEISHTRENVNCNSGTNGTIDVFVVGGTPPYHYQWSGNSTSTTEDLDNLAAGNYQLLVTDANGCTINTNADIVEPLPLGLDYTSQDINCNGVPTGAIDITISGGTQPYAYQWTTTAGITLPANQADLVNLASGIYNIQVTDANGCIYTENNITINEPPSLGHTVATTNVLCHGEETGIIELVVSGGQPPYEYAWGKLGEPTFTSNQDILTNIGAGVYDIEITDANDCVLSISNISILEPHPALALSFGSTDITCHGNADGMIDVTVTGGSSAYFYQWSNGMDAQDISSLPEGEYSVTVTDDNGCGDSIQNIIISEPLAITLSYTTTDLLCFQDYSGNIDITVTNGIPPYQFDWFSVEGHPIIENTEDQASLLAGIYNVSITDASGCTHSEEGITISEPSPLTSDYETVDVLCHNGNNGAIDLTIQSGTVPYAYEWKKIGDSSFSSTNEDVTNLYSGIYEVWVTDANGCGILTENITINEPRDSLSISYSRKDLDCFMDNSGEIDITVQGGTSPYSYQWSLASTATTADLAGVGIGDYKLLVTDANNCVLETAIIPIVEPDELTLGLTTTNILCHGENTGEIITSAEGGTMPYSYNWESSDGHPIPSNTSNLLQLYAGQYQVTITDNQGCAITGMAEITQPPALELSHSHTNVLCTGGNTGSIDITTTGGTPPYTYQWSGETNQTLEDIANASKGTYDVRVTDANGCIAIITGIHVDEPLPLALSHTLENPICHDDTNGSIDITITEGTAPYEYQWSGFSAATTEDLQNLAVGHYDVIITDTNGCTIGTNQTIILTEPSPINILGYVENAGCYNDNSASIEVEVLGGDMPYSYQWSTADTIQDLDSLTLGLYELTVTDSRGCSMDTTYAITQNDSLEVDALYEHIACFGDSTGYIYTTTLGGNPPYHYQWSGASSSEEQNINDLHAGIYQLTVTDTKNCLDTFAVELTQPDSLELSYTFGNPSCPNIHDGFIDVEIRGGVSPYGFEWQGNIIFSLDEDLANVPADSFMLNVIDDNGCSLDTIITITNSLPFYCNGLIVYNVISPNGDGSNDEWFIDGIEEFPESKVSIYNRQGDMVWETALYDNNEVIWRGRTQSGKSLPDGTYFYIIETTETPFLKPRQYKGWVQILR